MKKQSRSGFPETRKFVPKAKNRAKFVTKPTPPKSANYKNSKSGDWGRA